MDEISISFDLVRNELSEVFKQDHLGAMSDTDADLVNS
jgi:hypothetical protein